jgi:hypothetical protein
VWQVAQVSAGMALGASLWMALAKSALLANLFRTLGITGLQGKQPLFLTGLAWGLLPLVAIASLTGGAVSRSSQTEQIVMAFYGSGLTLVAPILHMWLEMRYRGSIR